MDKDQLLLKFLSVGDPEVGKSCLIKRYCEGSFVNKYVTTIGVDYGVKKINVGGRKVAVNFFDLSGEA
jgi:DnaJ family protein C protein 27